MRLHVRKMRCVVARVHDKVFEVVPHACPARHRGHPPAGLCAFCCRITGDRSRRKAKHFAFETWASVGVQRSLSNKSFTQRPFNIGDALQSGSRVCSSSPEHGRDRRRYAGPSPPLAVGSSPRSRPTKNACTGVWCVRVGGFQPGPACKPCNRLPQGSNLFLVF